MKKILKITGIVLLLVVVFGAGFYLVYPKRFVSKDLENKYLILKNYRGYDTQDYRMKIRSEEGIETYFNDFKNQYIDLTKDTLVYQGTVCPPCMKRICTEGITPTDILYKGYGNSLYGYFRSTNVIDCVNHYFIQEKNGDEEKLFGPFYE